VAEADHNASAANTFIRDGIRDHASPPAMKIIDALLNTFA
jgi:hypothetical protein